MMKKGLLILVFAVAAGVVAFYATRSQLEATHDDVLLDSMPEMAWLRSHLKLTDDQFARVGELHAAYRPQCAEMCRRISEAQVRLDKLARNSRGMTPELARAIDDDARVRAECRRRMLVHLYQTAALLDKEQAALYLDGVLFAALGSETCGAADCPHD